MIKREPNISTGPPLSGRGNCYRSHYGSINSQGQQSRGNDIMNLKLIRFTKIVTGFYGCIIITVIPLVVIGILDVVDFYYTIFEILLLNVIGSLAGAYGIYKWGTVNDQITRFKQENMQYQNEISKLQNRVVDIRADATMIQDDTVQLKHNSQEIEASLSHFDDLRKALSNTETTNENISSLITSAEDVYTEMETYAHRSKKAELLAIYYDIEMRDKEKGMSLQEYDRFLCKLTTENKRIFENAGSFEDIAGSDNIIDVSEMSKVIDTQIDQLRQQHSN